MGVRAKNVAIHKYVSWVGWEGGGGLRMCP